MPIRQRILVILKDFSKKNNFFYINFALFLKFYKNNNVTKNINH